MKFELGKYYEHTTGSRIYIAGCMSSEIYGMCFVGEDEFGNFSPVGQSEDNAVNHFEIAKEVFNGPTNRSQKCIYGLVSVALADPVSKAVK